MTVPVLWLTLHENVPARGYWDQGLLERAFDGRLWRPPCPYEFEHHEYETFPWAHAVGPPTFGSVVVIPGRTHVDDIDRINVLLARLLWALVIVVGNEESTFRWDLLKHSNMIVWVQSPDPTGPKPDRVFGVGYQVGTPEILTNVSDPTDERNLDMFFSGQITHARREQMRDVMLEYPGEFRSTAGFTQGYERSVYLAKMAQAIAALCPSGPATPDTFRLYEALEAGCVPIADNVSAAGVPGFWEFVHPDAPFPLLHSWASGPALVRDAVADWPRNGNDCSAWWAYEKRRFAHNLHNDIEALAGDRPRAWGNGDRITVLIPTSPIPSHPGTTIIDETIASVRAHLPDSEIIISFDGVRGEQEHRRKDYEFYTNRLLFDIHRKHRNVLPYLHDDHVHQGNLARAALHVVTTPLVLYVEHDTPLTGDPIDWSALSAAIEGGYANVIRLHHEASVLDVHEHLMLSPVEDVGPWAAPLRKTQQWSQRPHLASTVYYRSIIERYFGQRSRTMIEDVMHGVLDEAVNRHGMMGWYQHRVWLYHPSGDSIKRSTHLDGRGDDPKYDMVFAYDHTPPSDAPAPT